MKIKVLLVTSFLVNAGLLAAFLLSRPTPPAPLAEPSAPAETVSAPRAVTLTSRQTRTVETVVTNEFQWASVESPDYRAYIANLRAIACPEETVRDIIIADVSKLFASRVAALYPSPKDFKFWKVEDRANRTEERAREQKRRALDKEKGELIKELLGVDYETETARWDGRPDEDDWRTGFLSEEKQAQLKTLQDKFRELERAARSEADGGGNSPEARAKFAALRAQRESEMAQLLGPQEYEEYQLRNSWTARNMRENLASFTPSEEEFRQVFQLRKTFDEQFGFTRGGGDDAAREQRRLAQQQLDEQVKATLGEQRWHDYQLAQDERFRDLNEFTERNQLPRSTAESVYDMRRVAEEARKKVEADQTIAADLRTATLAALAEETRRSVSAALGEEAWKDYQRRDARWINNLARVEQQGQGERGGGRGDGERPRR